jgi:hypothetical protein
MLIICRLHFTVKFIYRYIENGDIDRDVGDTGGGGLFFPPLCFAYIYEKAKFLAWKQKTNMIVWLTNGIIICFETKIHLFLPVGFDNLNPIVRSISKT